MRLISSLLFRLSALVRWGRMREDLDEEMAFHIERQMEKHVAEGIHEDEARRMATREFGGTLRHRENTQGAWGFGLVQDLKADVRHTLRQLRRNPTFAAVAVFTLALGIGGATAVFSVVNGVLLEPLPFPDSHELVAVNHTMPGVGLNETPLSPAMYLTFREHSRTLEDIAVWTPSSRTVTGLDAPERVRAARVTDRFFPILGVNPAMGRAYEEQDVIPGSTMPVVLSHEYWTRRYAGDREIVGKTIRIEGNDLTIIGVTPAGFQHDGYRPDLFLPLVFDRSNVGIGDFSYPGIARLRPGVSVEDATRDMDRLTKLASEEFPNGIQLATLESRRFGTFVRPLKQEVVGEASTVIWIVSGTVGLVLIIACVNVVNLFLVRSESRKREVSVRLAIGASRGRLARQFLTESVFIGALGGVAGLFLAIGGVRLLVHLAPSQLPRIDNISVNQTTLLFTIGTSLVAGLLFGIVPAIRDGRGALAEPLKEGGRGGCGSRRNRLQAGFAVTQVSLALVLLIGSGLLIRSFQGLKNVSPGFQLPEEVLTLRISVPTSNTQSRVEAARTHQQILAQISQIPGVTSVSAVASAPMERQESWDDVAVEGFPLEEGEAARQRRLNWIAPGYSETMQNTLLVGRTFEWADILEKRHVVVVTENFAREYWAEPQRAIGGRVRNSPNVPWREIVGVVGNVHAQGVGEDPPTMIYWPLLMDRFWGTINFTIPDLRYVIRTTLPNPRGLLPQVREAAWSVNSDLPLVQVQTLDEILAASMARTSFTLVLLLVAAGTALILGTVGVYGVISYGVAQRTREMGIRMAVGARQADVRGMVVRQGGVLGVIGVLVGLVTAAGLTQLMSSLLFGVAPVDPATYVTVSAILLLVVFLASYIPARRAAAVDPTEALRVE